MLYFLWPKEGARCTGGGPYPGRVQADAYGVRKGPYGARGAQRGVDVGEQGQQGAGQGLGVVLRPHFEERDADQVRGRRIHR